MGLLSFGAQQGVNPLGVIGAALQDTAAGLNGQQGQAVARLQAGMLSRQQQAQRQAALQRLAGTITDPQQLAALQLDPEGFLKSYYEGQKPITLSEGQAAFVGGKKVAAQGKTGIADGFAYFTDPTTGQLTFGAQRPETYGEVQTRLQNDPNILGGSAWDRVQGVNLGRDRLSLDTTKAAQDYRLGLGNLGVAQQQLSLGRQKFDWEQSGGAARTDKMIAAQANLPGILDNANQFLTDIEKVKKDPQLGWRTGATGMIPAIPGSKGAGFDARVAQLQGQAFMRVYDGLRGTGQITEIEGKKATDSIARLNRAQNASDFKAALDDLAGIVRTGVARAKQQAGGSGVRKYNPATGKIE